MSSTETSKQQPASQPGNLNVESAVRERYSAASQAAEASLCCPVEYDTKYLDLLPAEIVERDYGCGNPSRDVRPGETVVDLGAGGGKICYIASQIVGPQGRVWGVDMNSDMLSLARRYQQQMAERIGWDNVTFFRGRIQDLALDLDQLEQELSRSPVQTSMQWIEAQERADLLRRTQPMIPTDSADVVISNCVLNLVRPEDRRQMFAGIYRVLRRGGRAVISDIVSDEPVPQHLREDPQLWSGCISGSFVEHELLAAFADAGFYGIEILERQPQPWSVVEGIEFRSVTVRAYKGKDGPCMDHRQAVIYKGPWSAVIDDDGHTLFRGQPMAVCEKTFEIYTREPYAGQVSPVPPAQPVSAEEAQPMECDLTLRSPAETKRGAKTSNQLPLADCCGPGSDCC